MSVKSIAAALAVVVVVALPVSASPAQPVADLWGWVASLFDFAKHGPYGEPSGSPSYGPYGEPSGEPGQEIGPGVDPGLKHGPYGEPNGEPGSNYGPYGDPNGEPQATGGDGPESPPTDPMGDPLEE